MFRLDVLCKSALHACLVPSGSGAKSGFCMVVAHMFWCCDAICQFPSMCNTKSEPFEITHLLAFLVVIASVAVTDTNQVFSVAPCVTFMNVPVKTHRFRLRFR